MKFSANTKDVAILAALADPIRLEIVRQLAEVPELTGAQLAEILGISRALFCHHASLLVSAGIATRRKAGQTAYLRLNASPLQRCLKKLGRRPSKGRRAGSRRDQATARAPVGEAPKAAGTDDTGLWEHRTMPAVARVPQRLTAL